MTEPQPDVQGVRLQKVLADAGVASRRSSEQLIAAGRVSVDGHVVRTQGTRIDPSVAVVRVDGERIPVRVGQTYLAANKPLGTVSTMVDPDGRPCLGDLVADRGQRLFHVGRLDIDTEGLIVMTNDGDLAHRLAHPSFEVTKTYVALVRGDLSPTVATRLRDGIELDDGPAAVDRIRVKDRSNGRTMVELDLHIGRNRIVRRMLDHVGHPVIELTRTAFGPLRLGNLAVGTTRDLSSSELGALLDTVAPPNR